MRRAGLNVFFARALRVWTSAALACCLMLFTFGDIALMQQMATRVASGDGTDAETRTSDEDDTDVRDTTLVMLSGRRAGRRSALPRAVSRCRGRIPEKYVAALASLFSSSLATGLRADRRGAGVSLRC